MHVLDVLFILFLQSFREGLPIHSYPTRRSSDLPASEIVVAALSRRAVSNYFTAQGDPNAAQRRERRRRHCGIAYPKCCAIEKPQGFAQYVRLMRRSSERHRDRISAADMNTSSVP